VVPTSTRESVASDWVVSVRTAFPNMANPLGTLFGGEVLALMDVGAAIAAQRFCRSIVVTASTEPIDFRNPIYVGEIVELKCRVAWTGRTSMIVRCEVHGENPLTGERRLCTIGHLNFVAIGEGGQPTAVPRLRVESEMERRHWQTGERVRHDIERRRQRKAPEPTEP
jgi:acyl-CoA hydrolase